MRPETWKSERGGGLDNRDGYRDPKTGSPCWAPYLMGTKWGTCKESFPPSMLSRPLTSSDDENGGGGSCIILSASVLGLAVGSLNILLLILTYDCMILFSLFTDVDI